MAIQGTQVPMYTKHILFLYFSDLKKKNYMKNKTKQNKKKKKQKQKHVKQSKA